MLESAEQAFELVHPDLGREGLAAEFLETTRFFHRATEGRLPVQMPDMQGPLDQAGNMLGVERLMVEMYDHPQAVHHLLGHLTQDFITYMRLQQEASGGTLIPIHCHPVLWLPPDRAMSLSEDLLAVISPALLSRVRRALQRGRGRCLRGCDHPFLRELAAQPGGPGAPTGWWA